MSKTTNVSKAAHGERNKRRRLTVTQSRFRAKARSHKPLIWGGKKHLEFLLSPHARLPRTLYYTEEGPFRTFF